MWSKKIITTTVSILLFIGLFGFSFSHFNPAQADDHHLAYLPIAAHTYCDGLYYQTFDADDESWFVGDTGNVLIQYLNGEYRTLVRPAAYNVRNRSSQTWDGTNTTSIDGRIDSGTGIWGFMTGVSSDGLTYYLFALIPDLQAWGLFHSVNGTVTLIADGQNAAINMSGNNRLAVVGLAGGADLRVNGASVYQQSGSFSGQIGLYTESRNTSPNTEFRFDNAVSGSRGCSSPIRSAEAPMPSVQAESLYDLWQSAE